MLGQHQRAADVAVLRLRQELRTPLHYAALQGHLEVVQFLAEEARVDVKKTDNVGCFHARTRLGAS